VGGKKTPGEHGVSHLQHSFSKENHFLPGLFDDKVLYLVPIVVRPTGSEVYFVNRVFLITRGPGGGFMGYVGDEIVNGGWMIRRGVQI